MRRSLLILLLILLLVGCSDPKPDPSPKVEPGSPVTEEPPPRATDPGGPVAPPVDPRAVYRPFPGGAKAYFPQGDATFIWTRFAREGNQYEIKEHWVNDGARIIVAREGEPVWTWLITTDGVWAPDPKNPTVLLRYLPPAFVSGMTWRQESGGEFVHFRLEQGQMGNDIQLTVLNRGERTDYGFNPLLYRMAGVEQGRPVLWYGFPEAESVAADVRSRILAAAPTLPTQRGALVEETSFTSYLVNTPGIRRELRDADNAGLLEQIVGPLGSWSANPIELYGPDGRFLSALNSFGINHAELVDLAGHPRLFLMKEGRLEVHWFKRAGDEWLPAQAADLGPKAVGWTYANRYRILADGRFEVEWEPGDPAGHRRIRTLQFGPDERVQILGERWEAVDGALRAPTSPLAALDSLFFAHAFGLPDEIAQYLAEPSMAAGVIEAIGPVRNLFDGVTVKFGRSQSAMYGCEIVESPVPTPAQWGELTPFAVSVQAYEGGTVITGQVAFQQEPDGRVLIQQLTIDGQCGFY